MEKLTPFIDTTHAKHELKKKYESIDEWVVN